MKDWKSHFGEAIEIEVIDKKGDSDKILISPLGAEDCIELMSVGRLFSNSDDPKIREEENKKALTSEHITKLTNLIAKSLKISYPESDINTLKKLAITYFDKMIPALLSVNFGTTKESALRKAIKEIENAKVQ